MPKYSKISLGRLEECHSDLQLIFNRVIKLFDNSILCGHRSEDEQNSALYSGNSKLSFPNSKHNKVPSMAVDSIPYPIDWKNTKRMIYYAGMVKAIGEIFIEEGKVTHVIRWGGDWDMDTETSDNKFNDLVHFELVKP